MEIRGFGNRFAPKIGAFLMVLNQPKLVVMFETPGVSTLEKRLRGV